MNILDSVDLDVADLGCLASMPTPSQNGHTDNHIRSSCLTTCLSSPLHVRTCRPLDIEAEHIIAFWNDLLLSSHIVVLLLLFTCFSLLFPQSPAVLRAQLFALTGVEPERQKVMLKGKTVKVNA